MIIGNPKVFAFDVADRSENGLLVVNIYIGNRSVCSDDCSVFLPSYVNDIEYSLNALSKNDYEKYASYLVHKSYEGIHRFIYSTRSEGAENYGIENDEIYPLYSFMDWGPTTDNLVCFVFPHNDELILTYEFWRPEHMPSSEIGVVESVIISRQELTAVLSLAIKELSKKI